MEQQYRWRVTNVVRDGKIIHTVKTKLKRFDEDEDGNILTDSEQRPGETQGESSGLSDGHSVQSPNRPTRKRRKKRS